MPHCCRATVSGYDSLQGIFLLNLFLSIVRTYKEIDDERTIINRHHLAAIFEHGTGKALDPSVAI